MELALRLSAYVDTILRYATCIGACAFAIPVTAQGIAPPDQAQIAEQMAVYRADVPGSIFALQPFRNEQSATAGDGTTYRLVSMNPYANSWFILEITPPSGRSVFYHLENADPETWEFGLSQGDDPALLVVDGGDVEECRPWQGELDEARESSLPYAPICDWSAYLRNRVSGNRSSREAVSDFLRDNILFGDSIVNLIKGAFFEDAFMVSSEDLETEDSGDVVELLGRANLSRNPVMRPATGFELEGTDGGGMEAGAWYAVEDAPGIYASIMQPGMIADEVFQVPGANGLDGVERNADVYLVAFDMSQFDIGYEVGVDHPRVDWSPRPSGSGRHYQGDGPDGFGTTDPLVRVGMLSPSLTDRVAAIFAGGYKRQHGAFRFGDYASFNWGHHYGFMQNGVVLSRLWPNLSTMYGLDDGTIAMRTWTEDDDMLLPGLTFARQNGVPLIEDGVPGDRVTSWGGGNWSGSANADLRTLRGGACIRTVADRQFILYGYFSSATPSGMARVFQAYGCDYAMLLDMNAPELTYMALYIHGEDDIEIQHLVSNMADVDQRRDDGTRIPRFVGFSDTRDFFYLLRRE